MKLITTFGEILVRLSTSQAALLEQVSQLEVHIGGSEANVAVALARMGNPVRMISKVPQNQLGDRAIIDIRRHGVDTTFLHQGKGRMGLYFLEQGVAMRGSQVVYDREYSSFAMLQPEDINWKAAFEGAGWFHVSGISPAVSQAAADQVLAAMRTAREQGLMISMDLNYRKNLWKYGKRPDQIMPQLVQLADVLLGDPATANLMLGTDVPTKTYYGKPDDLMVAYSELQQGFPNLKYLAMVLRDVHSANHHELTGVLFHNGQITGTGKTAVSPIIERIGGGDAFMAGLIHGISQDKPDAYTVNLALAASALKMTLAGDFNLFDLKTIEAQMNNQNNGMISR